MNEPCHKGAYKWRISQYLRPCDMAHESIHTYECVVVYAQMTHITHKYGWAMSQGHAYIRSEHTHINDAYHNICDMHHLCVYYDAFECVHWFIPPPLTHVLYQFHPFVCRGSFICVTRRTHTCNMTHSSSYSSLTHVFYQYVRETWLIRMRALTLSNVCHDSSLSPIMRVFYHFHTYVPRDSFICMTRRTHMCNMTDSYTCHDSLHSLLTHVFHQYHLHATHSYMFHDSFTRAP